MGAELIQIVGLLAAFVTGRQGSKLLEYSDFLQWLTEHDHAELRSAIEQNSATTISIKAILNQGLDEVNGKLDRISEKIGILVSRSDGVEQLAVAYAKTSLSDQVIEILTLMEESGSDHFLLSREVGVNAQRIILSPGPNYVCKEARFFRDDLSLMVELGLLLEKHNSKGEPMYYFTRAASKLVESINQTLDF